MRPSCVWSRYLKQDDDLAREPAAAAQPWYFLAFEMTRHIAWQSNLTGLGLTARVATNARRR
jgi:hypothetical protein